MFTDLALISLITSSTVVGQKGDFVTSGESLQNVVRANLAAGINRNQLARFDPQDFHRFFTILVFRCMKTVSHRRAQRAQRRLDISPCSLCPLWLFIPMKTVLNSR